MFIMKNYSFTTQKKILTCRYIGNLDGQLKWFSDNGICVQVQNIVEKGENACY